jgi:hypothetical protein
MATSSFEKQFHVPKDKTAEFADTMSQAVAPTLPEDFNSHLVYLSQDGKLRDTLKKSLSNK